MVYDYGSTVVYEGDQVIYNGEPVATAEEYSQQAIQIAAQGIEAKPADKEEWTPLGVFGMVQGDEQDANKIFQLAINKDGKETTGGGTWSRLFRYKAIDEKTGEEVEVNGYMFQFAFVALPPIIFVSAFFSDPRSR